MNSKTIYHEREINIRRARTAGDRLGYAVFIDGVRAFTKASRENALHNAKFLIDQNAYWSGPLHKWVTIPH
jgi:hypothetical protein